VKNYYSVLGVREAAHRDEIKRAYRNLMRKWHPDVNCSQDATRRTEEVNIAYAVLCCPESRYKHDTQLKEAGLSSKPLFKKTILPCLACRSQGNIKIYSSSRWHKFIRWWGLNVPYETNMCLECCGTGFEHKIEEY
jgi:curved DNA-binding protein CbpA